MQLEPGPETGEAHLLDQNQSVGRGFGRAPAVVLVTLNKPTADRTASAPATYLSNVCLINCRW
jgi:hypothetical protein